MDSATLERTLARLGVTPAQRELSVRHEAGALRADRVMVERAPTASVHAILGALRLERGARVDALLDAAGELPLITGWDATRRAAKVYVNASDASDAARAALAERLALPAPAHVVGLNALPGGEELKRYAQHATLAPPGPAAARLVDAAGASCGGVVTCHLADGTPRAWFVALRPASPDALDAAFGYLPGFSWAAIEAALPFTPAPPRSIGIAWERPASWTVYVKPADADEPPVWDLEPAAVFCCDAGEVGVHLGPASARAYAVVGDRSVSYRVRAGAPSADAITALLDWVTGELERDEPLRDPPPPWWRIGSLNPDRGQSP